MAKVTVAQQEGAEEVPAKIIAQAIVKIADATKSLYASGLNEKAIVLLISESSGVARRDVKYVLSHMMYLKETYLANHAVKP
jgi:cation transport regulator ChaC